MAADKAVGFGTLVKVDHDADTVFTTLELITDVKPPKQAYKMVDSTVLADTQEQTECGILEQTEFPMTHLWDPTDTNHTMLDTLFTNKTKVNWQIVFVNYPATLTMQFQGRVVELDPEPVAKDKCVARKLKILRTGAITVT